MRQKMADMVHQFKTNLFGSEEIDGVNFRQDEWTRKKVAEAEAACFLAGKCLKKPG